MVELDAVLAVDTPAGVSLNVHENITVLPAAEDVAKKGINLINYGSTFYADMFGVPTVGYDYELTGL